MIAESIKTLIILLIAIPFVYIVVDVIIDILKRVFGFYREKAKPVIISIYSSFNKF